MQRILFICTLTVSTLSASGCAHRPAASIQGTVTINGEPLQYGFISFASADGEAKTVGAIVKAGRYNVPDVPPGNKVVRVVASEAPKAHDGYDFVLEKPSLVIPPNASGNNQPHTIAPGEQTLDMQLRFAVGRS